MNGGLIMNKDKYLNIMTKLDWIVLNRNIFFTKNTLSNGCDLLI